MLAISKRAKLGYEGIVVVSCYPRILSNNL
jgi:hypothetical protein